MMRISLLFLFLFFTSLRCNVTHLSTAMEIKIEPTKEENTPSSIMSLTLTNPLSDSLLLLKWGTPLLFDRKRTFKITDLTTNTNIPYSGPMIHYGKAHHDESFVFFSPFETKTFEIDLSNGFPFQKDHQYQVSIPSQRFTRAVRIPQHYQQPQQQHQQQQHQPLAETWEDLKQSQEFQIHLSSTSTTFLSNQDVDVGARREGGDSRARRTIFEAVKQASRQRG